MLARAHPPYPPIPFFTFVSTRPLLPPRVVLLPWAGDVMDNAIFTSGGVPVVSGGGLDTLGSAPTGDFDAIDWGFN